MQVTIKNGVMTITFPLGDPRPSSSGKTTIVASTGGFAVTTAQVNGKPVSISLNATIPNK